MYLTLIKKELRKELKEKRKSIDKVVKASNDRNISEIFLKSNTFRLTDNLLCYYSVEQEVSTLEIISAAFDKKINVFLPRCTKDEEGNDIMIFHRVSSFDDLSSGMYNIPEPHTDLPVFEPKGHCVCIVPGLAFDKNGYRIGYGKGYYDRFLRNFGGTKIGLCYTDFLMDSLPIGKFDSKADTIITEKGIFVPYA